MASTPQWETKSFVLDLFRNPEDMKPEETNIVKILSPNGPRSSKERWWFQANLTYQDIKAIVQSVAKDECGFKITPKKASGYTYEYITFHCNDRKKHNCHFSFVVHECPIKKRYYLQSPGSCCWTHTNHTRSGGIYPLEEELAMLAVGDDKTRGLRGDEMNEINKIFIRDQGTCPQVEVYTSERLQKIVALPTATTATTDRYYTSVWIELLKVLDRDEDKPFLNEGNYFYSTNHRPSVSHKQVHHYLKGLTDIASDTRVFYCPHDESLIQVLNDDIKPTLNSDGFAHRRRSNHFSRGDEQPWPLEDHLYDDWQIYSYDARSKTTRNIGSKKKPKFVSLTDTDRISTLGNEEHGVAFNHPKVINIDTYDEEAKCWKLHPLFDYFEQRGFHNMRSGSYHNAKRLLTEQTTCYRGHRDLNYFDYVIFTMVNGWMWVFVTTPKGENVTGNCNKEFSKWFEGLEEGEEKEKIRKYVEKVSIKGREEMKLAEVDIHVFKLVAGSYLAFDAHELYHSTLTPKQDTQGYRQLIILHRLLRQG